MVKRLVLLGLLVALAPPAAAQEPAPVPLTLRATPEPVPALKYVLLPPGEDLEHGNAALLYQRAHSPEWYYHRREASWDKLSDHLKTPLKDLPRPDFAWVGSYRALKEVDRAARREQCDWEMLDRIRSEGIGLLLPDVQGFREYGLLLAMRARVEMADGRFDDAARSMQTSFALCRHLSEYPTLISSLVGIAIASMQFEQLEAWVQAPGSPNLYWALTDLPTPFVDLRKAIQSERMFLQAHVPGMKDLETVPLNAGQQEKLLESLDQFWQLVIGSGPKDRWQRRLLLSGHLARAYPEAKRALIARGRSVAEVEAMPVVQVVCIESLREFRRLQDDLYKWFHLPYAQAAPGMAAVDQQVRARRGSLTGWPFLDLLPALEKVRLSAARADRRLAALRCVEALRLYAAEHGRLPARLDDVKAVPIPLDPVSGKPFEYKAEGDKATLVATGMTGPSYGHIHYQITLTK